MNSAIEQYAKKLGEVLKKREWKLVTAESCTAGGLAYAVTTIPGSSNWFDRGFVTYSNNSKEQMLGIRALTLEVFGAVSEQTAMEMSEGALKNSQAQVSISITGIAGPDGGSAEKPVGTVWFACSAMGMPSKSWVDIFTGNRKDIREKSIETALKKLIDFVRI